MTNFNDFLPDGKKIETASPVLQEVAKAIMQATSEMVDGIHKQMLEMYNDLIVQQTQLYAELRKRIDESNISPNTNIDLQRANLALQVLNSTYITGGLHAAAESILLEALGDGKRPEERIDEPVQSTEWAFEEAVRRDMEATPVSSSGSADVEDAAQSDDVGQSDELRGSPQSDRAAQG